MRVENGDVMIAEKLCDLLTAAGEACVGLNGEQTVMLLGSLAAQIEASVVMAMPTDEREDVRRYIAGARLEAYLGPLMTLQAEIQAQA